ncbi:TetR/AcrR family transcriptional regulator [Pseudomonas sp. ADAK2]|uniref:TetR/AcrR family transcriptional regulator n=1 Tax=unclassified Pseudomonas TaxID=196821 RepID=UPI001463FEA8|nr:MULTISPECIES: TetR/AcrR family transcriptional regulator [unclassified Pseudomonas]QJI39743.1 TetR/AcrR family transcriptional regulator [Pseudomonas sp. ADAK7]QJI46049.1 TetR/AcrR family transcriptional regulator [Pseudomonas sp. ADAK2]
MKSGFGNTKDGAATVNPRAKPLKRPSQARAIFTVEAIYQAFVRIWQRDGWSGLTTREVALEAGVAIGTLYDYFPSKEALLSGYIRHSLDELLRHLDEQVVQANDLDWLTRIKRLICLTCEPDAVRQPLFNHEVFVIEHQTAAWLSEMETMICSRLLERPTPCRSEACSRRRRPIQHRC